MFEQTIIQQIIEAVETKNLAALCSPITRQIMLIDPNILDFLHDNYAHITP